MGFDEIARSVFNEGLGLIWEVHCLGPPESKPDIPFYTESNIFYLPASP